LKNFLILLSAGLLAFSPMLAFGFSDANFGLSCSKDLTPFQQDVGGGLQQWGYRDSNGNTVIEPQFDAAKVFCNGLAAVQTDTGWGYINKFGKVVIDANYIEASPFSNGYAAVKASSGWNYVDTKGVLLCSTPFIGAGFFSEHLAPVQLLDANSNIVAGYISETGCRVAVAAAYQDAYPFYEGVAAVLQNGKWGYVDSTGSLVIGARFDSPAYFDNGRARVQVADKFGIVDKTGKEIISIVFSEIGGFDPNDIALVRLNQKYGLIKSNGTYVIAPQFDSVREFTDEKGKIQPISGFRVGDRWAFIRRATGAYLINQMFDSLGEFSLDAIPVAYYTANHLPYSSCSANWTYRYGGVLRSGCTDPDNNRSLRWGYLFTNGAWLSPRYVSASSFVMNPTYGRPTANVSFLNYSQGKFGTSCWLFSGVIDQSGKLLSSDEPVTGYPQVAPSDCW